MTTTVGVLIVGAGQAGSHLAGVLRDRGYDAPILVVGEEASLPYQRPPLSKAYLKGELTAERLLLRPADHYERQSITVATGVRVTEIGVEESGAGRAALSDGTEVAFEKLALTTGAAVRTLGVPGADLDGVVYLRTLEDADRLGVVLGEATSVVVVGGGFIGLEAAAVATALGKQVTVIEAAPRLLSRTVPPSMSDFYAQAHERRGTRVRLGAGVERLVGEGRVTGVVTSDGETVPADVVIVGIGVDPRTELATALGLEVDRGIVVDEFARTSHPGVVAAGDCTVLPNPIGEGTVRLESVQNAIDQAEIAAQTLLGEPVAYAAVPWFWSDQADLKLQIAGLNTGFDNHVVRGDVEAEKFSVLYYRAGRFVAIDCVNRPADFVAARKALSIGHSFDPADVVDAGLALKKLLPS